MAKDADAVDARLVRLGLSENEAKVYLFLRRQGLNDASSVAQAVGVKRPNIYPLLDGLRDKGLVELVPSDVNRYGALAVERYIDGRIRDAEREIGALRGVKEDLSRLLVDDSPHFAAGTVKFHSHRGAIADAIERMTEEARSEIRVLTTRMGALRAAQHLFPRYRAVHEKGVRIRILIEVDGANSSVLRSVSDFVEVRHTASPPYMSFNIVDQAEMLMVRFSPDDDSLERGNDIGVWTDDAMVIRSFSAIYEQLWEGAAEPRWERA